MYWGLGATVEQDTAEAGQVVAETLSVIPGASVIAPFVAPVLSIVEDLESIFVKDNYQSQVFPICRSMALSHGVPVLAEWFGVFKGSDENGNAIQIGTSAQVASIAQDALTNDQFMQAASDSEGRSLILIGDEQGTVWREFYPTAAAASATTSPALVVALAIGAFLIFR